MATLLPLLLWWTASISAFGYSIAPLESNGVEGSDASDVPLEFDCKMRALALKYAKKIQPFRSSDNFRSLVAALNEAGGIPYGKTLCMNISYDGPEQKFQPDFPIDGDIRIFADVSKGSDETGDGSKEKPFKSISQSIERVRWWRRGEAQLRNAQIILRGGVYYLSETLELNEGDSKLTIQNYEDENAVISGAKLMNLEWKPAGKPEGAWVASLKDSGIQEITGLRFDRQRAVRARYPNGCSSTTDPLPSGYLCKGVAPKAGVVSPTDGFGSNVLAKSWIKNEAPTMNSTTSWEYEQSQRPSGETFQKYQIGWGGSCSIFSPPSGYWCQNKCSGGAPSPPGCIFRTVGGLTYDQTTLPNSPYKSLEGAVVQTWHPGHWASWMFKVDGSKSNASALLFESGGFQGARGNDRGEAFFIENVFEELDAINEFFYDEKESNLYYFTGSTIDAPPSEAEIVQLRTLLRINSTSETKKASQISLRGIAFRDTSLDFFGEYTMPSGGDWAIKKAAALEIQNAESVAIVGCNFTQLDGNAINLLGYNRDVLISSNQFDEIGASMITLLGYTQGAPAGAGYGMGPDGTGGDQPRQNIIEHNFATRCGLYEKQSSFYFQAKSCQNIIRNNIFFDGPRAAVNFNDGFGGGSVVEGNLIFNAVKETGDHGPFNSWDRQPFLTKVRDGETVSFEKAEDEIRQNFIIGNYYADQAVDNDDGSAFYNTHHNFFVYAKRGLKSDFGGHDNVHHSNVYAYME